MLYFFPLKSGLTWGDKYAGRRHRKKSAPPTIKEYDSPAFAEGIIVMPVKAKANALHIERLPKNIFNSPSIAEVASGNRNTFGASGPYQGRCVRLRPVGRKLHHPAFYHLANRF